jgi:hypothetical protein
MSPDEYRRHAAECLRIAENLGESRSKAGLIAMAQAWLQLARQAEKNADTGLVYETIERPDHARRA